MAIDYSRLAYPKGTPRVVTRLAQQRAEDKREREVRAQVNARDGHRCFFPGCKAHASDKHHVRPRSLGGEWSLTNILSSCRKHHDWFKAGLIRVTGNPNRGPVRVHLTMLGQQAGLRVPARKDAA